MHVSHILIWIVTSYRNKRWHFNRFTPSHLYWHTTTPCYTDIYHIIYIYRYKCCGYIKRSKFVYNAFYLAENWDTDIVALEAEDELEDDVSPRTLLVASIKVGLVGWSSGSFLVNNNTITSDIIGLSETVDWVQRRAISMILFTSSGLYSSGSSDSSTKAIKLSLSYSLQACATIGDDQNGVQHHQVLVHNHTFVNLIHDDHRTTSNNATAFFVK